MNINHSRRKASLMEVIHLLVSMSIIMSVCIASAMLLIGYPSAPQVFKYVSTYGYIVALIYSILYLIADMDL